MNIESEELIRLKNAQMIITHFPVTNMNDKDYNELMSYVTKIDNPTSHRIEKLLFEAYKKNQTHRNPYLKTN